MNNDIRDSAKLGRKTEMPYEITICGSSRVIRENRREFSLKVELSEQQLAALIAKIVAAVSPR
jgi:hypothetical protein